MTTKTQTGEEKFWVCWRDLTDTQKKAQLMRELTGYMDEIKFWKVWARKGDEIAWAILEIVYESYKSHKFLLENFERYKHETSYTEMLHKARRDSGYNFTLLDD